mmetsp:Transcript_25668/g.78057  ORF Transcript_25668/g.78057 Transcript_25668/m.78057 type:complete len:265 (+) Transcript_25668:326-1120(+)
MRARRFIAVAASASLISGSRSGSDSFMSCAATLSCLRLGKAATASLTLVPEDVAGNATGARFTTGNAFFFGSEGFLSTKGASRRSVFAGGCSTLVRLARNAETRGSDTVAGALRTCFCSFPSASKASSVFTTGAADALEEELSPKADDAFSEAFGAGLRPWCSSMNDRRCAATSRNGAGCLISCLSHAGRFFRRPASANLESANSTAPQSLAWRKHLPTAWFTARHACCSYQASPDNSSFLSPVRLLSSKKRLFAFTRGSSGGA